MRHIWTVVSCLIICMSLTASLVAQDKPLAEVTGSYQFNHLTVSADDQTASANVSAGFDASVNAPITGWFGAVGDIGRVWKTESASVGTVQASATASIWMYGVDLVAVVRISGSQIMCGCAPAPITFAPVRTASQ